jgi:two-component system, NarL family, response regulator LiaR
MTFHRVVVIEDHDLTRTVLQMSLERTGSIQVVGKAATATEGLTLLQEHKPDVAIVDVGLPDLDGIDVTRQIKNNPSLCDVTKVLILTSRDNEATVLAAFAAGADSYCMKDAAIQTLTDAIQITADGNSWIDPAIAGIVLQKARQAEQLVPALVEGAPEGATESLAEGENGLAWSDYTLTDRELEVLQLIVDGFSNAAIAEQLYISIGTVKTHVRHILNKLCADDRTQAAVRALRSGLVR